MFSNILGQKKVKQILKEQIKNNKIVHAYIFMGQDGVGKRLMAQEFAKTLNCVINDFTNTDIGACGKCLSCQKISQGASPDLHFIDFMKQAQLQEEDLEKQKVLKIETIRYMQKAISTKSHESKWKIFVIDPAEKMNIAAANSLLKTLEEPPDNTIIILIARHKETIPKTVVSRSQVLFFAPIDQQEIISWLMLNKSLDSSRAQEIANLSEGSLGNVIKFLEENEKESLSLWQKLKAKNLTISDILELSKAYAKSGALECIDAMHTQVKKEFRVFPQETLKPLELLNEYRSFVLKNANGQTVLDNLFFDLYELNKSK
ncbi:MAG: DNA polymerase III subunit delta' [Endomicrobium sp.]|jgi:DNA polymerase-3 subunit delta'|nr:DNA polymerase III subunit delta' [Endomicrobium sp.]